METAHIAVIAAPVAEPARPRRARAAWIAGLTVIAGAIAASSPASACTVTATGASTLGSYSPAAVRAGAVPALRSRGGLGCASGTLIVLGNNYVRATLHSDNGMRLVRSGGAAIAYVASANPAGSVAFAQDGTVDYLQNGLLAVLGLPGTGNVDLPFFIRPAGGAMPATGTYADRITIVWDWSICSAIGALGACVGTLDRGRATSVVDVTLDLAAKALTVTTSAAATWDPVNGTGRPRAVPGGRRRATVTVANPDIVPIDLDSVAVEVPIAPGERIALDGDGSGSAAIFTFADGSPASTLSLAYASAASTTDQVDFSADNGASWSYAPVAGNAASEARVTTVRLRLKGAMAAGSSFRVTLPTSVR